VLLLPIQLTNQADPAKGHNNKDTPISFMTSGSDTNINCVAWIAAHDPNNNDAPRMPHLVASSGSMAGVNVCWKLQVTFHDRHGNPHRDFDTGDPNDSNTSPYLMVDPIVTPSWYTADTPDQVSIPDPDTEDAHTDAGWHIIWDGTPWDISQDPDFIAAVAQGFFGGDAVLSIKIEKSDGTEVMSQQDFKFRIAGENPDPTKCKNYLTGLYGGPKASQAITSNPHAWFAWAIAKAETQGEGSSGYYNHFLNNGGRNSPVAGHEGVPNWFDDGTKTSGKNTDRLTGSGGYGLLQLTYASRNNSSQGADANYIMPRGWIWNWQANAVGFGIEFQGKVTAGTTLYNALNNTYSSSNGSLQNQSYGNFPALDAIIVTEYNGMYGGQMKGNKVPLSGYSKPQNSCWQPYNGGWRFLQNKENYAQSVNSILNGN
jgi:hypothetical protein